MSIWRNKRTQKLIHRTEQPIKTVLKQTHEPLQPVWTTNPCIACHCEYPEKCDKLHEWVIKGIV